MALDVSGGWEPQDDLRILEALGLGFSEYMLQGLQTCMAQLEDISPEAVLAVRDELTRYESAKAAKTAADLANTESKTLIKADVLSWQPSKSGELVGLDAELADAKLQIANYFAFCPYTSGASTGSTGMTSLIRS
jgi:hypothetical protein